MKSIAKPLALSTASVGVVLAALCALGAANAATGIAPGRSGQVTVAMPTQAPGAVGPEI
jgi:hypothetical protein